MQYISLARWPAVLLVASALCGCGAHTPQLHEVWEEADLDDDLALRVKKSIYCEFRLAVAALGPVKVYLAGKPVDSIPDDWGAQITLQLQVDETSALSASAAYNRTLPTAVAKFAGQSPVNVPQMFSLPVSGTGSTQATRIDKYYSFFSMKDLKKPYDPVETSCRKNTEDFQDLDRHGSSPLLSGDLGIATWLRGALHAQTAIPSSLLPKSQATKLDVLSYDIKFIIITNGTINPTWRLVSLSTAVGALPLFSANRTRTHDLLLTLGPTQQVSTSSKKGEKGSVSAPSLEAANVHLTGEFQQAISSAFRSSLIPSSF